MPATGIRFTGAPIAPPEARLIRCRAMAVENDAAVEGEGSALRTHSLALAALIVAAGFLGSRVLGLLRSVIIARTYGTEPELDAYFVAFRLPDLVFQLLAGATLASAF